MITFCGNRHENDLSAAEIKNAEAEEEDLDHSQTCDVATDTIGDGMAYTVTTDKKDFHELQPLTEEVGEFVVPSTTKQAYNQARDIKRERRSEQQRWRTAIDGYVQYSEWISKVTEETEDMPDLDSGQSITTTEATDDDPEAEYFIEIDAMNDVIAQIEKARTAQSIKLMKSDAKLEEILKYFEERSKPSNLIKDRNVRNYKMFICFACGRVFDDEFSMRSHVNESHFSSKDYKFKCKHCYRRFKLKHHLQRHERTHDLSLVHTCNRCSSSFRKFESLIVHKSKIHGIDENGEKIRNLNYNCSKCEQKHKYSCSKEPRSKQQKYESSASSTSSVFSVSSRPKVGTTCKICSRTFASRQSLLRHMGRIHPDEKINEIDRYEVVQSPCLPFACNICSKRFKTRILLLVHRKRHQGRKFVCELCDKTYPIPSELRKHIRRVHSDSSKDILTSKLIRLKVNVLEFSTCDFSSATR
ncbi:unnamed protein product [Thelazia callipaeda]|uniref:Zinc finger protein n=1 Tax=Thelazia callipaeda TaxID=103827 RepID=A0A0N5CKW6_THECL|nr:unnamed protein product [Thelazia callipaeda]